MISRHPDTCTTIVEQESITEVLNNTFHTLESVKRKGELTVNLFDDHFLSRTYHTKVSHIPIGFDWS